MPFGLKINIPLFLALKVLKSSVRPTVVFQFSADKYLAPGGKMLRVYSR